jgi:hypothetical protein
VCAQRSAQVVRRNQQHADRDAAGIAGQRQTEAVTDGLPTANTTLAARYVRVLVFCNSCRHQADADLQAIVLAGRGDVPLTELRFRCSQCGTDRTDFVVTSRDNPRPW